jgi:hypothetical protein
MRALLRFKTDRVNRSRERQTDLIAILEEEFFKPHSDQAQSLTPAKYTGLYSAILAVFRRFVVL